MSTSEPHTTSTAHPPRRLVRPADRMIAGVGSGLADYLGVDAVVVRIVLAALVFAGGAGLLIYALAWIIVPPADGLSLVEGFAQGERVGPRRVAAGVLLAVAALVALGEADAFNGGVWLVAIVAGAAILIASRSREQMTAHGASGGQTSATSALTGEAADDTATAETRQMDADAAAATGPRVRQPSLLPYALGTVLLAGGSLAAMDTIAGIDIPWGLVAGLGAAALGAAALVTARSRRVAGTLALGLVLGFAGFVLQIADVDVSGGIGERSYVPRAADLRDSYELGVGELELDLTRADLTARQTTVDLRQGIGEMRVIVPDDVEVSVRGEVGAGNLVLFGRETDGIDLDEATTVPALQGAGAKRSLQIDAQVDFGELRVERAR
ncbi:MAG: PspC domain-containing protein [Solirubrobacterales bacterium]